MGILVTGDIVLDCHVYGGAKTAATSFSEPGTTYSQHLGGAALTHELVCAAEHAMGAAWDKRKKTWEDGNASRAKDGKDPQPWPEDLPRKRPAFETDLALDTARLESSLPNHLRSYGVWTDKPARRG